jgi:hypothetical protein
LALNYAGSEMSPIRRTRLASTRTWQALSGLVVAATTLSYTWLMETGMSGIGGVTRGYNPDETAPFPLEFEVVAPDYAEALSKSPPEWSAPKRPRRLRWKGVEVSTEFEQYAARVARGEQLAPYRGAVLATPRGDFPWVPRGVSASAEPRRERPSSVTRRLVRLSALAAAVGLLWVGAHDVEVVRQLQSLVGSGEAGRLPLSRVLDRAVRPVPPRAAIARPPTAPAAVSSTFIDSAPAELYEPPTLERAPAPVAPPRPRWRPAKRALGAELTAAKPPLAPSRRPQLKAGSSTIEVEPTVAALSTAPTRVEVPKPAPSTPASTMFLADAPF